jgi:hypothetical protein
MHETTIVDKEVEDDYSNEIKDKADQCLQCCGLDVVVKYKLGC